MKSAASLFLLLAAAAAARAQDLPPASLSLSLEPDRAEYWAGERIDCTLRLDLGGDDLGGGGNLSLSGMPESDETLDVAPFAPAASAAGVRAWHATLTPFSPRDVALRPRLAGVRNHLVGSSGGFFRQYRAVPFEAAAAPRTLVVKPLPAENRPDDFCDAVGSFAFDAALAPTNVAPGDLATLRWSLRGPGAELGRPVAYDPGPLFKTYPPRVEDRGEGLLSVSQVVIPLSTNATAAAPFSVSVFDPAAGAYRTDRAGPFALTVAERAPEEPEELPTADSAAAVPSDDAASVQPGAPTAAAGAGPPPRRPAAPPAAAVGDFWTLSAPQPARLAPADGAFVLFDVPAGTRVRVRETRGAWRRVLLPDGASGWLESP